MVLFGEVQSSSTYWWAPVLGKRLSKYCWNAENSDTPLKRCRILLHFGGGHSVKAIGKMGFLLE